MFDHTVASLDDCKAALEAYGYRLDTWALFERVAIEPLLKRADDFLRKPRDMHVVWDPAGGQGGWLIVGVALEIARDTCQMIADGAPAEGPLSSSSGPKAAPGAEDLVRRLIREEIAADFPLSNLVAMLAAPYGTIHQSAPISAALNTLVNLGSRACNLVAQSLDHEAAARLAGWQGGSDRVPYSRNKTIVERDQSADESSTCVYADSWEEACEQDNLEPFIVPVSGHWAVSSWLAAQLICRSERVDTRFAGLNVWARASKEPDLIDDPTLIAIAAAKQYPGVVEASERSAFEAWAAQEWQNGNPPDNAWKGWIARARTMASSAAHHRTR